MLRTDVDDFLDLVKKHGRISLPQAAKILKMPLHTVEAWADFLEEERIIGREYKFTTPHVYMNAEKDEKLDLKGISEFDTKKEFYEKAQNRGLNAGQIKLLWLKYVNLNKEAMRSIFYEKAVARKIEHGKVDELWKKYLEYMESGEI